MDSDKNTCQQTCLKHCFGSDTTNMIYYIVLVILAVMIFFIGYNVGSRKVFINNKRRHRQRHE